jgi:hypothetical protein
LESSGPAILTLRDLVATLASARPIPSGTALNSIAETDDTSQEPAHGNKLPAAAAVLCS